MKQPGRKIEGLKSFMKIHEQKKPLLVAWVFLCLHPALVQARQEGSADLIRRLDSVEQQLRELRGELEEQQHQMNELKAGAQSLKGVGAQPIQLLEPGTQEAELYQKAQALLRDQDVSKAKTAMQAYLAQYPQGSHLADAYYWLGDLTLSAWEQDRESPELLVEAAGYFEKITEQFPKHLKTSDALLKLGILALYQKDQARAKYYFKEIGIRYPHSVAALVAAEKVKTIK